MAVEEARKARSFSRITWLTASATAEFGTSTTAATPSRSTQARATAAPMSALFWWSANRISTFGAPGPAAAMKSSAAICAATTEPRPDRSA